MDHWFLWCVGPVGLGGKKLHAGLADVAPVISLLADETDPLAESFTFAGVTFASEVRHGAGWGCNVFTEEHQCFTQRASVSEERQTHSMVANERTSSGRPTQVDG
eukprot:757209-Amphidinium_carterae.1